MEQQKKMQFDLSCPSCQTKFEIEKKDGKSDARSDWATRICLATTCSGSLSRIAYSLKFKVCSERLEWYLKCHETQCNAHFMFPYYETLELIFSAIIYNRCFFCRSCRRILRPRRAVHPKPFAHGRSHGTFFQSSPGEMCEAKISISPCAVLWCNLMMLWWHRDY